jgi:adenylate cyclase
MAGELEAAVLDGEPTLTRVEVAERAGVQLDLGRRLWRALGFPEVGDDERRFTDGDVEAVRTVARLLDEGYVGADVVLALARTTGQSLARLAEAQVGVLSQAAAARMPSDAPRPSQADLEALAAAQADELLQPLEDLIVHAWRRQLLAATRAALARVPDGESSDGQDGAAGWITTVGFADLVDYTATSRKMSHSELESMLEEFEQSTSDTVTEHGGRVVKMIGDEVMFSVDSPKAAAEIGLRLAEPGNLRVGLACGEVLSRGGDLYGPVVNLAARLTSLAEPGTVLVDKDLGKRLADVEALRTKRIPGASVRGYSHLKPIVVRRS